MQLEQQTDVWFLELSGLVHAGLTDHPYDLDVEMKGSNIRQV